MRFPIIILFCALILPDTFAAPALVEREWKVDGVDRKALVYIPPAGASSPAPVIFAFHGHGGAMTGSAKSFRYHTLWPEAICVYMQGLPTEGKTDPEGKKAGWQRLAGDHEDRDLKFFDAVWSSLKSDYKVDEKRVFVTGHSNGGIMTYLLWAERGDMFAAVAPMAAIAFPPVLAKLRPKPALHMAGEKDKIVPFPMQNRTMEAIRKLNGCDAEGKPWQQVGETVGLLYPSKTGTPFVSIIHPGPHAFPVEVPEMIVKFFKEQGK